MMLRGNLASRPFYNERIVTMLLVLVGVVALALTVWNVSRVRDLSARRSALGAQMNEDAATAARIRQNAVLIQNSVDRAALATLAGSAREANDLIDARTFSWTTFFGYIEDTIPLGVRLTSVSPDIEDGKNIITMMLEGRTVEDIAQFMHALEETGAFYDVQPSVSDLAEDGMERATVKAGYAPVAGQDSAGAVATVAAGTGGGR